jgi:hypothetical protein
MNNKILKSIGILGCMGILVLLIVILVLGGITYMKGSAASQSEIYFRSPQNGERMGTGQTARIRIFARDEKKITRVEFWADGRMIESQESTIPGGSSPFPLLTEWTPTPGTHTLMARSINSKNEIAQTTITIEGGKTADRDSDGVTDEADACPDQAGNSKASGCPDRDSDGIADSTDACPDVAGLPENGCPATSEGDADGDGVLDVVDSCPAEPGSPLADGCEDADGDTIADTSDACPAEPGLGDGCPTNDTDGDGVLDPDDVCPLVSGLPEHQGCPDTDGDGFFDNVDACPSEPGTVNGCPEAGGGDGAPGGSGGDESGSSGGEEGASSGGDEEEGVSGGGGIGDDSSWEAIDLVQLEALNFSVTQDYSEIYCYAGAVGRGINRYGPFESLGHREWDIVEYLGGDNRRTMGIGLGEPLVLRVECLGTRGEAEVFDLGSFTRSYDSSQWDGHILQEISGARAEERGTPGHSFNLTFRLCHRSCENAEFSPPTLTHRVDNIGPVFADYLVWRYDNRDDITGFKLYVNGHYRETIRDPHAAVLNMAAYMPSSCGEHNEYTITAYQREGVITKESPPSNSITIQAESCSRWVRVTFEEFTISGLEGIGGATSVVGPIYGAFWASGSRLRTLDYDGGECWTFLGISHCEGYNLNNGTYNIMRMFNEMNDMDEGCIGVGCVDTTAPRQNYVIVEMDEHDSLTIGGGIRDEEAFGGDERLYRFWRSYGPGETLPEIVFLEDENEYGRFVIRLSLLELEDH